MPSSSTSSPPRSRADQQAFLRSLALPWQVLVNPAGVWDSLRSLPGLPAALTTQWLLLTLGWLPAARPLAEGLSASGINPRLIVPSGPGILGGMLILALLIPLAALFLGALLQLALLLTSSAPRFGQTLSIACYSFMPAYLGRSLGLLLFGILQYLSYKPSDAVAAQFSPGIFGLNFIFAPLSFGWTLASFFDLFGLWSLWLCWTGLRRGLGLGRARAGFSMLALMLIWLLVLTLFWQGIIRGLP